MILENVIWKERKKERIGTKTHFQKEAKGYPEMAYC